MPAPDGAGLRPPRNRLCPATGRQVVHRDRQVRVALAEQLAPQRQRLPVKLLCFLILTLVLQHVRQVARLADDVRVFLAEQLAAQRQRLAEQSFRALVIALFLQHRGQVVQADGDERVLRAVQFAVQSPAPAGTTLRPP